MSEQVRTVSGCYLCGYVLEIIYSGLRNAEKGGGHRGPEQARREQAMRNVVILKRAAAAAGLPSELIQSIRRIETAVSGDDPAAARASVDQTMGGVFNHLKASSEVQMQFFEGGARLADLQLGADGLLEEPAAGINITHSLSSGLAEKVKALMGGRGFSPNLTGIARGLAMMTLLERDDLRALLPPGTEQQLRSIERTFQASGSAPTKVHARQFSESASQLVLGFARALL
jgi:hypothetical protein